MEKSCDGCFYEKVHGSQDPCISCGSGYNYDKWVAVGFLKNVPDDTDSLEGQHVMDQMIAHLERMKPLAQPVSSSPLDKQISGSHYKNLKIQPIEFIHANNIPFAEGCAIKYLTRWRDKGGVKDLEKAKHFIELLIELESRV